jgi:hypothetical protein
MIIHLLKRRILIHTHFCECAQMKITNNKKKIKNKLNTHIIS